MMIIVLLALLQLIFSNVVFAFKHNSLATKMLHFNAKSLSKVNGRNGFLIGGSSFLKTPQIQLDVYHNVKLMKHPKLVEGKLSNGLSYLIHPHMNKSGRFEAHLEILSGSAHELESQQGIAHLLEHVTYMGSPKRQLIAGTGSRTNAYTDFHHTVFFAACPTHTPDQYWKRPMLPMALDALLDVMTCKVDVDRLEKERAAVLSEASMVNKMEYRVESQVLAALHHENRISRRMPIGKEHLIKTWRKEDLQLYHDTHYRPDNAILYVVGDVDTQSAVKTIQQKFGQLVARNDHERLLRESEEFPSASMQQVNRHFPPVTHHWSVAKNMLKQLPAELRRPPPASAQNSRHTHPPQLPHTTVFTHDLLQSFSFHLFAKRPIEPITTELALKQDLLRRIALTALQIRLTVQQRQEPLFSMVDFNQLNWPREGCAVCSLDLTSDVANWRQAVTVAVREIKRMGQHGLTPSEFRRFRQSLLSESAQSAAQCEQSSNEHVLQEVMDCEAAGHTYMHPVIKDKTVVALLSEVTLDDVNAIAHDLCEHVSHAQPNKGVQPVAMIACVPTVDIRGQPCRISEQELTSVVRQATLQLVEPLVDSPIPDSLVTPAHLSAMKAVHMPQWLPPSSTVTSKQSKNDKAVAAGDKLGVTQRRRLSNGIKVNLKSQSSETQRVAVRIHVPGGRMAETSDAAGSLVLAARTMQEGGAFLNFTREQVELFCIDHGITVEIVCGVDALTIDLTAGTTSNQGAHVSGAEAAMQIAHILLNDFTFESDAYKRAKQTLHEECESTKNGLESACIQKLTSSLTGGDSRYVQPSHEQIDALSLPIVRAVMQQQLNPSNVEVSVCGDLPLDVLDRLSLDYFGTVSPASTASSTTINIASTLTAESRPTHALKVKTLGPFAPLNVHLADSDERAMGYLAGPAPNKWGVTHDGQSVAKMLHQQGEGKKTVLSSLSSSSHREHPLFGHLVMRVLEEIANRRLFAVVREERQLTYDASFHFESSNTVRGGWYVVSVTSSPTQVKQALIACKEALQSLRGQCGITNDAVSAAKRTLLNQHKVDVKTNKYWVEILSSLQSGCSGMHSDGSDSDSDSSDVTNDTLHSLSNYESVLNSITAADVQQLVELFHFDDAENMTECVGIAAPIAPSTASVETAPQCTQHDEKKMNTALC